MTDKSKQDHVLIFDTTLRDGEQSPGATMTHDEKLEIAEMLDDMGVDIIEAGFPIASEGDFKAVKEIAERSKNSTICGLARANFKDIDRCYEAVKHSASPRIHTFIGTSPLHRAIPDLTMDEMADKIHETVSHGIRNEEDDDARYSEMPAFGDILEPAEISSVVNFVQTLSGGTALDPAKVEDGKMIFADNCAACHGESGQGDIYQGAPNLSDAIWLYGGDYASLTETVTNSRYGVMPPWTGRLTEWQIRAVSHYVHQLGGGE